MTETEKIADVIVAAVRVATATLAAKCLDLETKIVALEARAPVPGPQGERGETGPKGHDGTSGPAGRDGIDGKDAPAVDLDDLALRAAALVPAGKDGTVGPEGPPGAQGEPGRDGVNGKDAPPVDIDDLALRAAALVPAGKDGKDGRDGQPGVPGRDGAAGERGEKGLDGKDGAAGRDGTLDALRVEQIDERRWRFVRSDGTPMPGDPIYLPMMVYKGVFVESTAYDKGDAVTFGGSLWIARETTKNKPGDGSTAWQLAAKEGRRGSQGVPGKDGAPGPKGERGDPGRNFS